MNASATSVKTRLKNHAKASGRTVQDMYTVYVLERVLYRISISPYAADFTLKGGILLHGMYAEDFSRATTDIGLLGSGVSNDSDGMARIFARILSLDADDPIRFDVDASRRRTSASSRSITASGSPRSPILTERA